MSITRPLSRIRSITSARPLGLGARAIPPPAPFLDVNAVVAIYFRPPALLRDLLREDGLLVDDERLRVDPDDLPEPFFEPRLRLRLEVEVEVDLDPELEDRERRFGSPPLELFALVERLRRRGFRSGSSSSSASSSPPSSSS